MMHSYAHKEARRTAMRRVSFAGVIVAMLGLAAAAVAQERFDYQVRDDMFRAFGGNEAAFRNAMAKIEETLAANPDHAEALVWRGAGTYWKAGQAFRDGDAAGSGHGRHGSGARACAPQHRRADPARRRAAGGGERTARSGAGARARCARRRRLRDRADAPPDDLRRARSAQSRRIPVRPRRSLG